MERAGDASIRVGPYTFEAGLLVGANRPPGPPVSIRKAEQAYFCAPHQGHKGNSPVGPGAIRFQNLMPSDHGVGGGLILKFEFQVGIHQLNELSGAVHDFGTAEVQNSFGTEFLHAEAGHG